MTHYSQLRDSDFPKEAMAELPLLIKEWQAKLRITDVQTNIKDVLPHIKPICQNYGYPTMPSLYVMAPSVVSAAYLDVYLTHLWGLDSKMLKQQPKADFIVDPALWLQAQEKMTPKLAALGLFWQVLSNTPSTKVYKEVGGWDAVWKKISKQKEQVLVFNQALDLPKPTDLQLSRQYYASQHIQLCVFYTLCKKYFPDSGIEQIAPILEVIQQIQWFSLYSDTIIMHEKPIDLRFDEQGRLHSSNAPALLYRDNAACYYWHDQQIPSKWITEGLTATQALKEPNTELRRCACELLGYLNIVEELGYKIVDTDPDIEIGKLIAVNFPTNADGSAHTLEKFVWVTEGHTGRQFMLAVPPDTTTAVGGHIFLAGFKDLDIQYYKAFRT